MSSTARTAPTSRTARTSRTAPTARTPRRARLRRLAVPAAALALTLGTLTAAHATGDEAAGRTTWAAAWGASPQAPSTGFTPNWSQEGFSNQSVRQVVRVTERGDSVRIRLSNAYGTSPLHVTGATVARTDPDDPAGVVAGSVRRLTFGSAGSVTIPARGELRSDATGGPALGLDALDRATVTLYFAGTTGPATFHAQGWTDSYRAEGDHRADVSGRAYGADSASWYYLSGVEVQAPPGARGDGVVVLGDSITDGFGSTPGTDRRYPDALAERTGRPVLNAGIGGNLLLNDSAWYGERATARFGRDALGRPGVSTVVVLLGLNDIGFSENAKSADPQPTYRPAPVVGADELISGYRKLIRAAHRDGLRVVGGTLLPLKESDHWGPHAARVSDEVNTWIRTSGAFDAVADFDRALADPADPDRLHPAYDFGDRLHPNDAGYRVMARTVADAL